MDLSALSNVDLISAFNIPTISSNLDVGSDLTTVTKNSGTFQSALDSAVSLIKETNDYSNKAEEEEIKFAAGQSDSIHDLQIAQQKANMSLQYTVAVRNALLDGYKEIMNLQF